MVPHSLRRQLPALLFVLAAAILAASLAIGPGRSSSEPARHGATHGGAATVAAGHTVSVIVQHAGSAPAATAAVIAEGGTVTHSYTLIPALAAELPADAVERLVTHEAVRGITANRRVRSTSHAAQPALHAPAARAGEECGREQAAQCAPYDVTSVFPAVVGATELWGEGITGAGVGIAFIDSGLDEGARDDFGDRVLARVSVTHGQGDRHGHGSLVASIAAGDGAGSGERFTGVAPGALVVAVKVGDFDGYVSTADVIAGLEWVLAHREAHAIRVVNLSLSEGAVSSYLANPLNAAVEQLWQHGIVVVAAQGNLGDGEQAVDHAPGNDPFVISVGAFSDAGTVGDDDDYLKAWSSRGVTHDGFAKPELVAPGSRLIGSVGQGSAFLYRDNPEHRIGRHYLRFSGTSAAAPVVSGIVALMLQHEPELTPGEVKARLMASARTLPGSDAGRVDAYAAVHSPLRTDANAGIEPSRWLSGAGTTADTTPVAADGIRWDGIRWDGIRWD